MNLHPLTLYYHNVNFVKVSDWTHAIPSRPHWRLYWNPEKGGIIRFNSKTCKLSKKNILLIPPDTPVERELKKSFFSFYVHFSIGLPYDLLEGKIFNFEVSANEKKLLNKLAAYFRKESKLNEINIALNALLFSVLSKIPVNSWPSLPEDDRIVKVIEAMEADPGKNITNSSLSKIAGMSTNAFIRFFSAKAGKAPQAFLMELRMKKACNLLIHTDKTIELIAEECGFCDRSYFSRTFKRFFNTGPAFYRKKTQ